MEMMKILRTYSQPLCNLQSYNYIRKMLQLSCSVEKKLENKTVSRYRFCAYGMLMAIINMSYKTAIL